MKKVFLSLATIAFVAAGSLTVTSCGGDDSTPGPGPGEEDINEGIVNPQGSFKHGGKEYKVENQGYLLHGSDKGWAPVNFGTEAEPDVRSLWVGISFSGESNQDARNNMEFCFTLPTKEVVNDKGETVYQLIFPNEAEDIQPFYAYAEHKGEELDLSSLDSGGITFNTFVLTDSEASSNNSSVWGSGTTELLSHTYNGSILGIQTSDLSSILQSGKNSVKTKINYTMSTSNKMLKVEDFKKVSAKLN